MRSYCEQGRPNMDCVIMHVSVGVHVPLPSHTRSLPLAEDGNGQIPGISITSSIQVAQSTERTQINEGLPPAPVKAGKGHALGQMGRTEAPKQFNCLWRNLSNKTLKHPNDP